MTPLQNILSALEVGPGDKVALHELPPIIVGAAPAIPTVCIVDVAEIEPDLDVGDYNIVPLRPITGYQLELERQQFAGWLENAIENARSEGGDGLLLGYDSLNPEQRLHAGNLDMTDQCVFLWDRPRGAGPMFEWEEIASLSACRGSDTACIYLADGRAIYLHADVDWHNRLS